MGMPVPHVCSFIWPVWEKDFSGLMLPRCVNKRCACGAEASGLSFEERTKITVLYA